MENQETRFIIYTEVNKVEKIGDLWYANFLGSWESLALGEAKPFEVGDQVKISIEKVIDEEAKPVHATT
jgi:hypothetical protein